MSEEIDLLMLRNVHPHFVDNGRVGSGGFSPSAEHNYELSVDFDILSSPDESRERHEKVNGLKSGGVFGVTVAEFDQYEIECRADPVAGNPAHALADYSEVKAQSTSKVRKVGRTIAALATKRGKLD